MQEQLELLWQLQRIDFDLKIIEEGRERYPKELKWLDEKIELEGARIQKEKEKLESQEQERRRREAHLNAEQEKIKRSGGRMFEVKTNKEYQAFLAEIEVIKEANSREEEEILRLLEEIDEGRKGMAQREKEVAAALKDLESEKKKIQEKMARDDEGYEKSIKQRKVIVGQLESKLYKLYSTLKAKRQNVSVARVVNETCQGCFLNIPPQLFREVQRNNTLIQCPHCNRILYWEEDGRGG